MNNRFELPEVNFFEKPVEEIEKEMLVYVEEKTGITLENADPRRKFIQGIAMYIAQERIKADYSFKQNLLSYARGDYLDHKGIDTHTKRIESTAAKTTMKLSLEDERVDALIIPKGTRFLVGNIYFATLQDFIAAIGVNSVEVDVECTEKGEKGNGFLPGEITKLVDLLPWVNSVENTMTTTGGADTEGDDEYANRIRISPEKFTTAGSNGAYEYWAYTAHQNISDVVVDSPEPGCVDIYVLCKEGKLPTEDIIQAVENVCSDDKIRPLTDVLEVKSPEVVHYNLHATYYISDKNETVAKYLKEQIEAAYKDYLIWQKSKIGRSKDFTELIKVIKNAGASRVSVTEELFTEIQKNQVAVESEYQIIFGGFEYE